MDRLIRKSIRSKTLNLFTRFYNTHPRLGVPIDSVMSLIPTERIRNFTITAHIDHGKSTLADRLLEITGAIKHGSNQCLDKLSVERKRGITIKAQTASMFYLYNGQEYLLNLVDTPGHVDFSYEVARSCVAVQGALLLVDACQGIQAQTVNHFYTVFGEGLEVVPIDLPNANVEKVEAEIMDAFELMDPVLVSAKTGSGVDTLIRSIIERIPAPTGTDVFRGFLFDSWYDQYKGVVCLISVKDGLLKKGDKITSAHSKKQYEVHECGIMHPDPVPTSALHTGQVGYIVMNMKSVKEAFIGDTYHHTSIPTSSIQLFKGFALAKPTVYAGLFPLDQSEYNKLSESLDRLTLNDSSVSVKKESSISLGQGFRLGFLGTLHMDVFKQRLEEEHDALVINTMPTVPYKIKYHTGEEAFINNPLDFPDMQDASKVKCFLEPIVRGTLIFPKEFLGWILTLCGHHRATDIEHTFLDSTRIVLKCTLPLAEILTSFHDSVKSITSGYGSFEYVESGYDESSLEKIQFLVNSKAIDTLVYISHASKTAMVAKEGVKRIKAVLQRDLFDIVIQASVGGKIVARESHKALRRDVTAKCYGGDITRKMKLLDKQKEGKKRMKMVGGVNIPSEAFLVLTKPFN